VKYYNKALTRPDMIPSEYGGGEAHPNRIWTGEKSIHIGKVFAEYIKENYGTRKNFINEAKKAVPRDTVHAVQNILEGYFFYLTYSSPTEQLYRVSKLLELARVPKNHEIIRTLKKDFEEFTYPWDNTPIKLEYVPDKSLNVLLKSLQNKITNNIDNLKAEHARLIKKEGMLDKIEVKYVEQKIELYESELIKVPQSVAPLNASIYERIKVISLSATQLNDFSANIKNKLQELEKQKEVRSEPPFEPLKEPLDESINFQASYDVYNSLDELLRLRF
jgi:hypothetical protein